MERKRSSRNRSRYRNQKSTWTKIKDFIRQFIAFMFSNVGIIGLVVGYTICGAFMFGAIEGREAIDERAVAIKSIRDARKITARKLWEASHKLTGTEEEWKMVVLENLRQYQEKVIEAISMGYDGTDNVDVESSSSQQWSFSGAFLYSLTVITTIGYGNVAPKTEWGKVATIFYAIIGMPLFLLYLSNIGDILAKSFKWTYSKCFLCRGCKATDEERRSISPPNCVGVQVPEIWDENPEIIVPSLNGDSSASAEDETVTVPVTLCLAIMVGYICGGAKLFVEWEGWSFLDSSYFCFISLSTIGFGDLVPGDKIYATEGIELSFIFCSMYLMLGMAIIAMCFNLMQEEVIHKFRTCGKAIKNCFTCGADDKDGPQVPTE